MQDFAKQDYLVVVFQYKSDLKCLFLGHIVNLFSLTFKINSYVTLTNDKTINLDEYYFETFRIKQVFDV